ncbi:hypothetical protein U1763_00740 [Sphingomonas sp. LB2R24]
MKIQGICGRPNRGGNFVRRSFWLGNHVRLHVVLDALRFLEAIRALDAIRQSCADHTALPWKDGPYAECDDRIAAVPAMIAPNPWTARR